MNPGAAAGRARKLLDAAPALEAWVASGRPADRWISSWFRANPGFGARDRRCFSETLFSLLRWRGWIGPVSVTGPAALYLADRLLEDPGESLAEALAGAAGLAPGRRLPPLGPASLGDKARALGAWFGTGEPPILRLAPDWVPGSLALPPGEDPVAFPGRCLESFQRRPALWLLALGIPAETLAGRLQGEGLRAEPEPRCPGAVRLDARPHFPVLERRIGPCFEAQDLASQAVAAACETAPGELWWDACCGGGGKTIGLAARLAGGGRVEASDLRATAVRETLRRIRRAGLAHAAARTLPGLDRPPPPGRFDGVLLDAPCSGLGTWSRAPDARWRTDGKAPERFAARQAALLAEAARAVRPGGRLVYSVCTLTRAETLGVTESFRRARPDFRPDPFAHPLGSAGTAAEAWILPWQGPCGAMFLARWRREGTG